MRDMTQFSFLNWDRVPAFRCITALLCCLLSTSVATSAPSHDKGTGYNKYACGPQVLSLVLQRLGKSQTYERLFSLSSTQGYQTTLEGMRQALLAEGLNVQCHRATLSDLPDLARDSLLICHTKRNHYVLVTRSDEKWLTMIDTYMGPGELRLPPAVFGTLWDGVVLAVSAVPPAKTLQLAAIGSEEAKRIVGGQTNCENTPASNSPDNGAGGGKKGNQQKNTKEPVNTTTGNFFLEKTDLAIPGRGFGLDLARTYNAQTTSIIEGWMPEVGAGTWVIEDGEYSGEGDRAQNDRVLVTPRTSFAAITLDMQTIQPGANYGYEVARVNFHWTDENNRYYALLNVDGRLELTRYKAGTQSFLASASTTLDPRQWNKFQIRTKRENTNLRVQIVVNELQYIEFVDTAPLSDGRVVLESFYCHAHYDNIILSDLGRTISYDFNTDDNDSVFGYGWTSMLDCSIRELANGNVIVLREGGRKDVYSPSGNGNYTPPKAVFDKLIKDAGGYTLLRLNENIFYRFDLSGRLLNIRDRNNNTMQFQHAGVLVQ